jgi:hypothetical protein
MRPAKIFMSSVSLCLCVFHHFESSMSSADDR